MPSATSYISDSRRTVSRIINEQEIQPLIYINGSQRYSQIDNRIDQHGVYYPIGIRNLIIQDNDYIRGIRTDGNLKKLILINCSELKAVSFASNIGLQIEIRDCSNLFFVNNFDEVNLIDSVYLENCYELKKIKLYNVRSLTINDETYGNMQHFELEKCDDINVNFSGFVNLETFQIKRCILKSDIEIDSSVLSNFIMVDNRYDYNYDNEYYIEIIGNNENLKYIDVRETSYDNFIIQQDLNKIEYLSLSYINKRTNFIPLPETIHHNVNIYLYQGTSYHISLYFFIRDNIDKVKVFLNFVELNNLNNILFHE